MKMEILPSLLAADIGRLADEIARAEQARAEDAAGAAAKTWNLSNPADRAEFAGVCSDGLWVEGIGKGSCVVELSYSAPASGNVCDDKVKYTFIAADCGRQPRTDSRERKNFEGDFPNLVRCEWSITGEDSRYYNCLAWAIGKTDVWVNDIIKINGVSVAEAEWDGVVFWGIDKRRGIL